MPIGTYAFILEPIDETSTRFLVRDRAAWSRREWLFKMLVYEPLHAWMEMGLLRGVRQRAEGDPPPAPDRHPSGPWSPGHGPRLRAQ